MREAEFAKQVNAEQEENHNPERNEYFSVENAPAICKVGHGEEFKCESKFKESEYNLDSIHPSATLRHGLEHGWEHCKDCEGECQS